MGKISEEKPKHRIIYKVAGFVYTEEDEGVVAEPQPVINQHFLKLEDPEGEIHTFAISWASRFGSIVPNDGMAMNEKGKWFRLEGFFK